MNIGNSYAVFLALFITLGIVSCAPITNKCLNKTQGGPKWACFTDTGAQETNRKSAPGDHHRNHHPRNHHHGNHHGIRDNKPSLTTERLYSTEALKSTEAKYTLETRTSKPFESIERALPTRTSNYETIASFTDGPKSPSTVLPATPAPELTGNADNDLIRLVLPFVCGFVLTCVVSVIFICCKRHVQVVWRMLQGTRNGDLVAVRALPNPVYRADTPDTVPSDGEGSDDDQSCPTIKPYAETSLAQIQARIPVYQNDNQD
ncbi:Hypp9118 [Branchiostoma lanceolatum]|uniref:Hypp9118 protein n=1 Tax=Branchiostoma lanceolatum TaxID=7740 RepID=A0A8K0EFZ6_BRALA|nr:Hypp9118 [Branchiostoma lanceolatum]